MNSLRAAPAARRAPGAPARDVAAAGDGASVHPWRLSFMVPPDAAPGALEALEVYFQEVHMAGLHTFRVICMLTVLFGMVVNVVVTSGTELNLIARAACMTLVLFVLIRLRRWGNICVTACTMLLFCSFDAQYILNADMRGHLHTTLGVTALPFLCRCVGEFCCVVPARGLNTVLCCGCHCVCH